MGAKATRRAGRAGAAPPCRRRSSLSVSRSLNDRLGSYLEWFGNRVQGGGSANYANAGVTWLFSSNEQLDVRAGRGLGATRGDYFVGVGLSRRW